MVSILQTLLLFLLLHYLCSYSVAVSEWWLHQLHTRQICCITANSLGVTGQGSLASIFRDTIYLRHSLRFVHFDSFDILCGQFCVWMLEIDHKLFLGSALPLYTTMTVRCLSVTTLNPTRLNVDQSQIKGFFLLGTSIDYPNVPQILPAQN